MFARNRSSKRDYEIVSAGRKEPYGPGKLNTWLLDSKDSMEGRTVLERWLGG